MAKSITLSDLNQMYPFIRCVSTNKGKKEHTDWEWQKKEKREKRMGDWDKNDWQLWKIFNIRRMNEKKK